MNIETKMATIKTTTAILPKVKNKYLPTNLQTIFKHFFSIIPEIEKLAKAEKCSKLKNLADALCQLDNFFRDNLNFSALFETQYKEMKEKYLSVYDSLNQPGIDFDDDVRRVVACFRPEPEENAVIAPPAMSPAADVKAEATTTQPEGEAAQSASVASAEPAQPEEAPADEPEPAPLVVLTPLEGAHNPAQNIGNQNTILVENLSPEELHRLKQMINAEERKRKSQELKEFTPLSVIQEFFKESYSGSQGLRVIQEFKELQLPPLAKRPLLPIYVYRVIAGFGRDVILFMLNLPLKIIQVAIASVGALFELATGNIWRFPVGQKVVDAFRRGISDAAGQWLPLSDPIQVVIDFINIIRTKEGKTGWQRFKEGISHKIANLKENPDEIPYKILYLIAYIATNVAIGFGIFYLLPVAGLSHGALPHSGQMPGLTPPHPTLVPISPHPGIVAVLAPGVTESAVGGSLVVAAKLISDIPGATKTLDKQDKDALEREIKSLIAEIDIFDFSDPDDESAVTAYREDILKLRAQLQAIDAQAPDDYRQYLQDECDSIKEYLSMLDPEDDDDKETHQSFSAQLQAYAQELARLTAKEVSETTRVDDQVSAKVLGSPAAFLGSSAKNDLTDQQISKEFGNKIRFA